MVKKTGPSKKAASSSKQSSSKKSNAPPEASSPALQSEEEQQRLLDIFSNAFNKTLSSDEFTTTLQEIKQALFNREFATAFGREDYLEAYAARWSPTRALCYATVLLSIKRHLNKILIPDKETPGKESDLGQTKGETTSNENDKLEQDVAAGIESIKLDSTSPSRNASLHMLSVGGCAAEHIAFASYIQATSTYGHLTLLDSGPWAQVVSLLESSTVNPPPISKYASAARQAANRPMLGKDQLSLAFVQKDVLNLDLDSLSAQCADGKTPILLTMLFTLNELYTTAGIGKTTKFLKNLGQVLAPDSLVLVVDSPGSYSEAALGKEKKKYPMQWLLDHTLIETETPGYSWEKLQSDDSTWFRLSEDLSYPIALEDMRYQMHLYRLQKPI
ncbi:hypothetical protein SNK03_003348 [Fusarium graminearum]|uniref:Chromosome 1, complete genome n=2 Tax=Gibberella zeae TaxID=5518 RepID=I1RZY9_GIBZE|nr:hypothetical protein FGSG_09999 [Fusarium graminearum PH-1]EYB26996.1 hypothetical protein FG05_09999 [Fusarium graminearum]ESU16658.1 hypothetical protein FGSG_09999 [Fusarium graminearum PH-1]KAI6749104.1 hypothetical protein HG531_008051 [Fusarium graminearum]PCD31617.1 hypothetical protein FGRA07_10160 [Fusarium graminearum]CAF3567035.1 unnamed protein product [Fusarium graminearum]|eukprot:XP_011318920.1 hypothetical protein FGSG_09999 [Fusarium graminearum PH-1]